MHYLIHCTCLSKPYWSDFWLQTAGFSSATDAAKVSLVLGSFKVQKFSINKQRGADFDFLSFCYLLNSLRKVLIVVDIQSTFQLALNYFRLQNNPYMVAEKPLYWLILDFNS